MVGILEMNMNSDKGKTPYNSRFPKAGASCFYESEVLNSIFVQLMKLIAKNPLLRKAQNVITNAMNDIFTCELLGF
jgi:hypothetical protein